MKKLIILSYSLLILGFSIFTLEVNAQESNKELSNQIIVDSILQKEILYGYCTSDGLRNSTIFSEYYKESLKDYNIDSSLIRQIDDVEKINITILLGTWCPDSQREVPRFLEILKTLDFKNENLTIIALDRKKNFKGVDISKMRIRFVPTFIIYRDKIEVGRIVEKPVSTLELELLQILN